MVNYDFSAFYQLSQAIESAKNTDEKLRYCEEGLKLLPGFVSATLNQDGELPPVIFCRDVAPELYMRRGDWAAAERVIRYCMECRAYYPETGEEVLRDFEEYRDAACMALIYIGNHPGTLQKDIYKKLERTASSSALKSIMRSSELIRKEKGEKTNRLFLAHSEAVFPAIGIALADERSPATCERTDSELESLQTTKPVSPVECIIEAPESPTPVLRKESGSYVFTLPKKRARLGAGIVAAVLVAVLGVGGYVVNSQIDLAAASAYSEGLETAEAAAANDVRQAEKARDRALSEAESARTENENLSARNDDLAAQVDALTTEAEKKDAQIEELQSNVSSLNTQLTEAKEEATEAQAIASQSLSSSSSSNEANVTRSNGSDYDSWGDGGSYTVYVTNSGTKYHNAGCRYLSNSSHAMSLSQAQAAGYTPCSVCH